MRASTNTSRGVLRSSAALTADFASRRRSEIVQDTSLAAWEASLHGGQAKMLSDRRLRRGCAAAGTVRRGRSSARSEPCFDGHSGPNHDRAECAKSRTQNELVFIGQRHVASSDQTQGCCTVVVRTLCQRLRFRESSTGQYARMPPQMPLRKRVESRAGKHFEDGPGPHEGHTAGSQTGET